MPVIDQLKKKWNLRPNGAFGTLESILHGMKSLPYENLSKILENGDKRSEEQLVRDHFKYGTGGTCFSLVSLLLTVSRSAGLEAKPILADRTYGPNTHCAAVISTESQQWLADPGFLIHTPVPLQTGEQMIDLPHTRLRLDGEGNMYTVHPDGHEKFRYRLHEESVSDDNFRDLLDESYEWEMMNQLVVNRILGEKHIYLRDRFYHEHRKRSSDQKELSREEVVSTIEKLGIDRSVAEKACATLNI